MPPARATIRNLVSWGHTQESIRVEEGHTLDISYSNCEAYDPWPGNVFDFEDVTIEIVGRRFAQSLVIDLMEGF